MVVISTVSSNENGSVKIYENHESKIRDASARVSRSATLDGGAVITHNGFCDGDLQFDIRTNRLTQTEAEQLWDLFTDETQLIASTELGVYVGAIERLKIDRGDVRFVFLVKEKISN